MDVPPRTVRVIAIVACFLVTVVGAAHTQGSLVILDPTISGNLVTLPIHLQGNVLDGVAALDFQLSFDVSILEPVQVEVGDAAAAAGRQIDARLLPDGQYVVLMFGLGLNAVAQGEVARVSLNKVSDPNGGESAVTILNTKFATVSGLEIPSQGSTTTLLFDSDSGNESGDAGGLPPTSVGASPIGPSGSSQTSTPRNTKPSSPVTEAGISDGGASTLELAKARAAVDAQLSILRGARADREAARAMVERPPGEAGKSAGVRVRRESHSSGEKLANSAASPGNRPGRIVGKANSVSLGDRPILAETVQSNSGGQPDLINAEPPTIPGESRGMEPITEGESALNSAFLSDIRFWRKLLAGCFGIVIGLFLLSRWRGR